jgi:preprotein translocase subunit SecE
MAKDDGIVQTAMRRRTPFKAPAGGAVTADAPKKPFSFNPIKFLRETRAEARKITWTSWKETWITSVMVAIMVVMTGLFFAGVDGVIHFAIGWILKIANAE